MFQYIYGGNIKLQATHAFHFNIHNGENYQAGPKQPT